MSVFKQLTPEQRVERLAYAKTNVLLHPGSRRQSEMMPFLENLLKTEPKRFEVQELVFLREALEAHYYSLAKSFRKVCKMGLQIYTESIWRLRDGMVVLFMLDIYPPRTMPMLGERREPLTVHNFRNPKRFAEDSETRQTKRMRV